MTFLFLVFIVTLHVYSKDVYYTMFSREVECHIQVSLPSVLLKQTHPYCYHAYACQKHSSLYITYALCSWLCSNIDYSCVWFEASTQLPLFAHVDDLTWVGFVWYAVKWLSALLALYPSTINGEKYLGMRLASSSQDAWYWWTLWVHVPEEQNADFDARGSCSRPENIQTALTCTITPLKVCAIIIRYRYHVLATIPTLSCYAPIALENPISPDFWEIKRCANGEYYTRGSLMPQNIDLNRLSNFQYLAHAHVVHIWDIEHAC